MSLHYKISCHIMSQCIIACHMYCDASFMSCYVMLCPIPFYSTLYYAMLSDLFHSILFCFNLLRSILFYLIAFYPILSYSKPWCSNSILFYSIIILFLFRFRCQITCANQFLFYSILWYSMLLCSVPFFAVLCCSVHVCSALFYSVIYYPLLSLCCLFHPNRIYFSQLYTRLR